MISIKNKAAERTTMNTNSKGLFNDFTTGGTDLRSPIGIDLFVSPASIFSFAFKYAKKHSPCCIVDALGKMPVLNHVGDFKFLDNDKIILLDDWKGDLVTEIESLVRNLFVTFCNKTTGLLPALGAFLSSRKSLLSFLQDLLGTAKELRSINLLSVTGRKESIQPHVNADAVSSCGKDLGFGFNRKGGVPLGIAPCNADTFGFTYNQSVPSHLHMTNILEVESAILDLATIAEAAVTECVESLKRLVARIARILSRFHSAKERLECFVQSPKSLLKRRIITGIEKAGFLSNLWKKSCGLFGISNALTRPLVSLFSLSKSLVIKKAVGFNLLYQGIVLVASRVKTVLKGSKHLFSLLTFNILSDSRLCDTPHACRKVAPAPKSWKSAPKRRKLLPQDPTCVTLEAIDDFCNTSYRFILNKHMKVIWHDLKGMNRNIQLGGLLGEKLSKVLCYHIFKHRTAVLWTPNKMHLEAKNCTSILSISFHKQNYTTDKYLMQAFSQERRGGLSSAT